MYADIRGTRLFFDVEGAGLVPDGAEMRQKPVLFVVPGGPGGDHSGFKPAYSPLSEKAQLVYFDHRGSGRSAAGPLETYTMDNHVADLGAQLRMFENSGHNVADDEYDAFIDVIRGFLDYPPVSNGRG